MCTCLVSIVSAPLAAADELAELAEKGSAILKSHCYGCHGEKFNGNAQFNVMDSAGLREHGYVVEGKPDDSPMWQRIAAGEMPPEDSGIAPLTASEKEVLRSWVAAGGPQALRSQRAFKHYATVIAEIYADLSKAERNDRVYYRYFTLTHLSNNYAQVTDFDLRLYRAALSKALNSLSYQPDICLPVPVDVEETVFRIDLRDFGWDSSLWSFLTSQYPYGIHFHNSDDEALASLDEQIDLLSGCDLCWIRADWFINTAPRPPVYDRFLNIPENVHELEQRLNVDVNLNFEQNRLMRAGFATSGVSTGNRLVERHSASYGYYWKSYDFKDKGAVGNLFRFPLGPVFPGNRFAEFAFQHDGGEMIFSLPNGLQGYMLTTADGKKIAKGPIEVVRDSKETAGTPEVVNGISCMHCHRHGMIGFRDSVRDGVGLFGEARRKVRELYPEDGKMQTLVAADEARFLKALNATVGSFVIINEDAGKSVEEFAEPIGAVARFYQRDLDLNQVAFELGIENPETLRELVKSNRELIRLGLGPLASGQTIKRAEWENRGAFISPYQETMNVLGLATPVN
jgi:hypothetical protein